MLGYDYYLLGFCYHLLGYDYYLLGLTKLSTYNVLIIKDLQTLLTSYNYLNNLIYHFKMIFIIYFFLMKINRSLRGKKWAGAHERRVKLKNHINGYC